MTRNPATSTDPGTGALIRRIGEMLIGGQESGLDDAFQAFGQQLRLSSALWLQRGDDIDLLASYPEEEIAAAEAYLDRVLELAADLTEPLIRRVDATDSLLAGSQWQAVWPLPLEDGYAAIWLAESSDESFPELSSLAQLIRAAVLP